MPAGALRGAVQPAEGPARAVSERGLGAPAGPLRHLPRPAAVPGATLLPSAPQGARAGKLPPSCGARAAFARSAAGPGRPEAGEREAAGGARRWGGRGAQSCRVSAVPGPARAAPAGGRAAGMVGTGSWGGQGSSRHVWSVRGRAAPLCKSALQRRMIVTHRVINPELRRLHCVSAATLLLLVLVFNICTAVTS